MLYFVNNFKGDVHAFPLGLLSLYVFEVTKEVMGRVEAVRRGASGLTDDGWGILWCELVDQGKEEGPGIPSLEDRTVLVRRGEVLEVGVVQPFQAPAGGKAKVILAFLNNRGEINEICCT